MNPITEQKCPKCGAPMRFDPGSGLLVCDNCGNWITLDEAGKAAKTCSKENPIGKDAIPEKGPGPGEVSHFFCSHLIRIICLSHPSCYSKNCKLFPGLRTITAQNNRKQYRVGKSVRNIVSPA